VQSTTVVVTRDDQMHINSFSKLNAKSKELAAEVAARKVRQR
jgi:hypothetical protein